MDTFHQCTNVNSIDLLNFTRSKQKPNDYCKKIILFNSFLNIKLKLFITYIY